MSDRFLVPVGFYCGPFFAEPDEDPEYWQIRVGRDVYHLPTYDELNVWMQTRGALVDDHVDHSRSAVCAAAEAIGVADADGILDTLIESGLVVEVGSERWPLEEFAASFSVQPLMVGVGNSPDRPEEFRLGIDQAHVYAGLNQEQYDVWSLGYLARNLREAAQENVRSREPDEVRPEIERLCRISGELLLRNAAYVDLAWAEAEPGGADGGS